jgi:sugar-specific transcriptional regulator TrmB
MNETELIALGFNRNEAKVYLSLIKYGGADANTIIKDTKFHKNIVYDNLEKLIDKGLVAFIIEDGVKLFQLAPPHMLVQFFAEKKQEAEENEKKALSLSRQISAVSKEVRSIQKAVVYRGIKGVRAFYSELLEAKKDYVVFGAPKESVDIMGEHFWLNLTEKSKENRIKQKMIFNSSLRDYGKKVSHSLNEIRYFDDDFEPFTETNIQGGQVAIIVWTKEPVIFLIQDKIVADNYRKYFEDMWKRSKK